MDHKTIDGIEEEIKSLHLNPKQQSHSFSKNETKEFFGSFWIVHVRPVIEYSKDLAKKHNADLEAVWLAAILHDISRLDDLEPHDEIGAKKAYDLLREKGFEEGMAKKVYDIIFTHRCQNHMPETLEQKILATADAVSHFKTPFYLWWEHVNNFDLIKSFESGGVKIERDFNDKIFFEEEKELVRKEYEVLKNWFNYNSKI